MVTLVIKGTAEIWTTFAGGGEGVGGKETLEEGMGRRRRKIIIIIKEIQKSDTFFIFTNTADIISKTNIFVWLLTKLLYLPCFSLKESILGGLMLILEQQRPKEQRPRISTFDNTFTGDLPTPPQLPFSPSINQPTFFLPASEQSLSTEQV